MSTARKPKTKKMKWKGAPPELLTLALSVILSLAIWMFFSVFTPDAPLTSPEMAVVVGACAAVVFGGKWIWSRLRGRGTCSLVPRTGIASA